MALKTLAVVLLAVLRFFIVSSGKTEGSRCEMADGGEGFCRRLEHCEDEWMKLHRLDFPKFCSYNVLTPLVCCRHRLDLNSSNVNSGFYPIVLIQQLAFYFGLGLKVSCNGIGLGLARALIGYGHDRRNADWMCGGSVISDKYILTAGHCISSPNLGKIKYAALGILKRTDSFDKWQIYDIVDIIPHPDYKPPSKYHDIALLATGTKIQFNTEVGRACLNRGRDMPIEATATGWGATGHKKPVAENLQFVTVKKFSDEECMKEFPTHRLLKQGYDKNTQACYGDQHEVGDTCEGDSGGPLQSKSDYNMRSQCLYNIVGVTSYGRSCGFVGNKGMYTRVSYYVPWIETITGKLP